MTIFSHILWFYHQWPPYTAHTNRVIYNSCSYNYYYHTDSRLFFFLLHRSTASLTGNSSTGGPSIAILNTESRDFSVSRFREHVFINFSWENVFNISSMYQYNPTNLCYFTHDRENSRNGTVCTQIIDNFSVFEVCTTVRKELAIAASFMKTVFHHIWKLIRNLTYFIVSILQHLLHHHYQEVLVFFKG